MESPGMRAAISGRGYAAFRARFPSRREFGALVAAVTAPLNFWAVLQFLNRVPALILRLPTGDILAILAYILSASLLETLLVCSGISLLAALLPRQALRNPFLPSAIAVVYVSILWTIAFHYLPAILAASNAVWPIRNPLLRYLGILGSIIFTYVALILRVPYLVRTRPALQRALDALVERLSVLSALFLAADALSLLVVILRNLF
ncbi:MAG: hypothetical protein Fur0018_12800 [Anaerolineales bacterium]